MMQTGVGPLPPRFVELKKEIVAAYPDFEQRATKAWGEILQELKAATDDIAAKGSDVVPQVEFANLKTLDDETRNTIRRRGCVVVKNVVDDEVVTGWRKDLEKLTKENPVVGVPEDNKQFFMLYWTKSQVRARSHPNVLEASTFVNNFYHVQPGTKLDGVDLSTPLSYADRFRLRHPGGKWLAHPPHIDGGSIERWEDDTFREVFADIFRGDWRKHDPYDLNNRVNARSSLYGKPNQASVFRAYQGWLALSETGPSHGTLQVFPNIYLSNSYLILRPFFAPVSAEAANSFDPADWKFDISTPEFHGVYSQGTGYLGPAPNVRAHPHLQLDKTMVSVPTVNPGDMVFWHCDLIHAVEVEHTGPEDSCVMYIPAVPKTPANAAYIEKQKEAFLKAIPPSDYPNTGSELKFEGCGTLNDIDNPFGRKAMGFAEIAVAA